MGINVLNKLIKTIGKYKEIKTGFLIIFSYSSDEISGTIKGFNVDIVNAGRLSVQANCHIRQLDFSSNILIDFGSITHNSLQL